MIFNIFLIKSLGGGHRKGVFILPNKNLPNISPNFCLGQYILSQKKTPRFFVAKTRLVARGTNGHGTVFLYLHIHGFQNEVTRNEKTGDNHWGIHVEVGVLRFISLNFLSWKKRPMYYADLRICEQIRTHRRWNKHVWIAYKFDHLRGIQIFWGSKKFNLSMCKCQNTPTSTSMPRRIPQRLPPNRLDDAPMCQEWDDAFPRVTYLRINPMKYQYSR